MARAVVESKPPWEGWRAPPTIRGMITDAQPPRPSPTDVRNSKSFDADIRALQVRLVEPLPGVDAQREIAPSQSDFVSTADARALGSREGGALVLVYPHHEVPHLVLTLRNARMRQHAGQVSLPGGRRDEGEGLEQTALREAWEELAIPRHEVQVLGRLTPIYIPPSEYLLFPLVGTLPKRPSFVAQPSEVAAVIEAPVDHFVGPTNRRAGSLQVRGITRHVPFFEVGEYKVWGATAMILSELARVWADAMRDPGG
jgi:8-oxo-dGTP pyrophosphatase MutT (NUDIX family)